VSTLPAFDPRQVPVVSRDAHLPAVPVQRLAADDLRRWFRQPPDWTPEIRAEARWVGVLCHVSGKKSRTWGAA